MPLRHLKNIYEKRRTTLSGILDTIPKNDKKRYDEINGAITEIDSLLKTIDTLRTEEIVENQKLEIRHKQTFVDKLPLVNSINDKVKQKFESSKTRENLDIMFQKKCEMSTRYELSGMIAKDEGHESIAQVFFELSTHEREQARIILEYMKAMHESQDNIKSACNLEHEMHHIYAASFEKTAKDEHYNNISEFFKELAQIDGEHEKRLIRLFKSLQEKRIYKEEHIIKWRCKNCGYTIEHKEAPMKCTICKKGRGFFDKVREE